MVRKLGIAFGILALLGLASSSVFTLGHPNDPAPTADTKVADLLFKWGEPYPDHRPAKMTPEMVEAGRGLVHEGLATDKSRVQSRYFVCTDCHNMSKEDPDLRVSDPEARLGYVKENDLAFLQGTTMFGTVNKESWYNGDYYKKYGDLVKPANQSLKEAIQLCAQVCSQGRALNDWEMDAVLAYFWSIDLSLGDLSLSAADMKKIEEASVRRGPQPEMVEWLKGYYRAGSPATFVEVPENKHEGYEGIEGDPERGRLIFDVSCLHCHDREGPSNYLKMDHDVLSLGMLRRNIARNGHLSLYEIVRHGTYADKGHRAYMPHYPAERMSNQQLEDLRAYVESDI